MSCSFCLVLMEHYLDVPFGILGILLFQIQIPCCERPKLYRKSIIGASIDL